MTRDDPTVKVHTDEETKDTILSGMGELHLEITLEKIKRALNLPQGRSGVVARQAAGGLPANAGEGSRIPDAVHQADGRPRQVRHHQHALHAARLRKASRHGRPRWSRNKEKPDPNNVYFDDEISGGVVPKEYIPAVEDGIRNMAKKGSKYPFPFVDLECVLFDGKYHDVDSSQDAFRLAAEENFRDVQQVAGIKLLEPIMTVVVVGPEQYQGSITGDINRRRGMIEELSSDKGRGTIKAKVPLANLFGYDSDLKQRNRRHGKLLDGVQPLRGSERSAGGHSEAGEEVTPLAA